MAVTPTSLRGVFSEFANVVTYPDSDIQYWLDLGVKLLNAGRWGNLFNDGQMLFAAHNLSLEFNAKKAAAVGRNPGEVQGPLTSASIDKVSYSRDVGSVMDPKNGHWNLSIYGLRYIRLVKLVGMGPVYVGAPSANELDMTVSAWPGVTPAPY